MRASELRVLRLETRVLYIRLAFGVHNLENFKSALLRYLDANVTSSASGALDMGLCLEQLQKVLRPESASLIYVSRFIYQMRV